MKQVYLSLLFCLLTGLMQGAQALPPDWITDAISENPEIDDRFTVQSFAMGPDNTYHMVLERWDHKEINENGGFILYYMSKPCDGEWSEPELIHTLGESCVNPTIACDEDGRVFVCYQRYMPVDYWSDVIYVAERTEDGWVREEIPTPTPYENWMPQMSMDANGKLHIAWAAKDPEACDDKSIRLREDRMLYADKYARPDQEKGSCGDMVIAYSTNLSGEWATQMIKAPLGNFGLGAYPRLEVSPEGTAHMVFRGMDAESDPDFPVYRIYYGTNLMPGGDIWELAMLQSEMLYDEEAFLVLQDDVVHVALGGSNAWELPNYTFYLKREEGTWSTPLRVNQAAFGYPTSIAMDEDGNIYVTYISEAGQSFIGELYLWKKSGNSLEEIPIVNEENLCANDFLFDLHGNALVPYLTWKLNTVENPFFELMPVMESPQENDRLSKNPVVFDLYGNLHLITEASPNEKGTEETGQRLMYFNKGLLDEEWGLPDTINIPQDRPVLTGTSMAAYNQDYEQPGLVIGYLSETEEVRGGSLKTIPHMVIGEQTGEAWFFEDLRFDLSDFEPLQAFLTVDVQNRRHAAVFGWENTPEKEPVPVLHYGVKEGDEWQIQSLGIPVSSHRVEMLTMQSGAALFVVATTEGASQQIRILTNNAAAGTNWTEQSFESGSQVETLFAKYVDPFLFIAVQGRQNEQSPSKIEMFILLGDQDMLGPLAVSHESLSDFDLHSMDATFGNVTLSYAELRNEGTANTLSLATLNNDFLSFSYLETPDVQVYNSFLVIDFLGYFHILTEQGEPQSREISEIFMGTSMDLEQSSKLMLLRSGECLDFTGVEPLPLENALGLFPNPASHQLNIRWDEAPHKDCFIAVYDLSGRLRLEEKVEASQHTGEAIPLDISSLEEGLYLVRLVSGNQQKTAKFLVR